MKYHNVTNESYSHNEGRRLSFIEKLIEIIIEKAPFKNFTYKILLSKKSCDRRLRVRLSFLLGIIYGLIIYSLTAYRVTNLPPNVNLITLICLPAIISIGMATVPALRCFMLLVIFNFISSSGKVMITGHIINSIIDGPVNNTIANSRNFLEMFKCNIEIFRNLTELGKQQSEMSGSFLKKIFNNDVNNRHSESIYEIDKLHNEALNEKTKNKK